MLMEDTTQNLKAASLPGVVLRGKKKLSAVRHSQRLARLNSTQGKSHLNHILEGKNSAWKYQELKDLSSRDCIFPPSTAYFIMPNPVCSMASDRVDIHHSVEEDNLSRQGEPSAKGITMHQFSSKAINSWSELLVDSLFVAKWGRGRGRTEAKREGSKLGN